VPVRWLARRHIPDQRHVRHARGLQSRRDQRVLNVGGASATFLLDSKGRGKANGGTFTLRVKKTVFITGGVVAFQARLKGALRTNWADEGLTPTSVLSSTNFTCMLDFMATEFAVKVPVFCKVSLGRGIRFKN
jgi:hypothetical protein